MIALSKNNVARAWFNMIEIIFAMGVLFIAILSIMSLIPIGVKASRDSRMESYAADAAHGLLDYIAFQMQRTVPAGSWATVRDALPTEPMPIDYDDLAPFGVAGVGNEDPDPMHYIHEELAGVRYWELENLSLVDLRFLGNAQLYSRNDARYALTDVPTGPPFTPPQPRKIYRLILISTQTIRPDETRLATDTSWEAEREVTELDAIIRVWRSQVKGTRWHVGDSEWKHVDIDVDDVVQLNIEVAWPAQASSHRHRHKVYYTREVVNQL